AVGIRHAGTSSMCLLCVVTGWQEREKDGLPRLIEALGSTMWRGMEMKSQTSQREGAAESKRSDELQVPVQTSKDEGTEQTQPDVLEQIAHTEQELQLPSFSAVGSNGAFGIGGGADEEDGMGAFDDILQSVARIRDAAMNGNMTDEERRVKA